ncbi:hypothetical protein ACHAXS_013231 [Conticribra weissflogii]
MFGVTRKKPRPSNNRRRVIQSRDSSSSSSSSDEDGEKSKESSRVRASIASKTRDRSHDVNGAPAGNGGNSSNDSDADSHHRRRRRHRDNIIESNKEKKKQSKKDKKPKSKKIRGNTFLSFGIDGDGEERGGSDGDDDGSPDGKSREKSKKKRKKHSKDRDGDERRRRRGKSASSSKFNGMGLGYGGAARSLSQSSEDDNSVSEGRTPGIQPTGTAEYAAGGSLYDKAALEKLKMEQKTRLGPRETISSQPMEVDAEDNEIQNIMNLNESTTIKEIDNSQEHADNEEECIPLSGENTPNKYPDIEPIVLTGDDALAYANDDDEEEQNEINAQIDHGLHHPPSTSKETAEAMENTPLSRETQEENRKWENEIARRAGVLPATAVVDDNAVSNRRRSRRTIVPEDSEESTSSSSLIQIRSSLQQTIENLQTTLSDLDTAIRRHESTISSAREEAKKHEETLEKHGKALEYYQCLREDLATWVGALRELKKMVDLAENAKHHWEGEITWRRKERSWECQEDVMDVLEKKGLLEKSIVGDGQSVVPAARNKSQPTVDEFGRDLASMATMARTKRWERRRQTFIQRRSGNSEASIEESTQITNEVTISNEEIIDWKQRHQAFGEAIELIPMMVQDEYLSTSNLCKIFIEWERLYPDDYKNCYAEMTLVQMISVLVRLELCQRWDTLALNESLDTDGNEQSVVSDLSKFKWFKDLDGAFNSGDEPKNNRLLTSIIHKCIIPQFISVLTIDDMETGKLHGLYDPYSSRQTKRLCSFFTSIVECLDAYSHEKSSEKRNDFVENTIKSIFSVLQYCLESETIPIVKSSDITIVDGKFMPRENGVDVYDNETSDAIAYATIVQAKTLCRLALNMLDWLPILDKAVISQSSKLSPLMRCVFIDLVAVRILPIIQSLQELSSHELFREVSKEIISQVYFASKRNGLLEKDEFILFTAPLRAAAERTIGI